MLFDSVSHAASPKISVFPVLSLKSAERPMTPRDERMALRAACALRPYQETLASVVAAVPLLRGIASAALRVKCPSSSSAAAPRSPVAEYEKEGERPDGRL